MFTRRLMTTALAASAIFASAATAQAQEKFPSRTIRIIVPFAAGGGVDVLARLLAERMAPKIGVNVIIENRAGASGTVGGAHVLQSAPDGYTVLFSSNTHTMSKLVMASAPYDPLADFTPIARGGEAPLLAVLAPKLPQKTLAEVAAAAQKEPDKWTAAVPSLGSPGHVATNELHPPDEDQHDDHAISRHGARADRCRGRTHPDADRCHGGAAADG